MMYDEKKLSWYDEQGVDRPEQTLSDVTPDTIREKLTRVVTTNWRMSGNILIADTDQGPLHQTVPTNLICMGTDSEGLPIFKKIG